MLISQVLDTKGVEKSNFELKNNFLRDKKIPTKNNRSEGCARTAYFFPGAFGTGVGCEFPFPSVLVLVLLPPTHCRSPSSLSESAISIGKMAFFGDGSPRNLGAMQIS